MPTIFRPLQEPAITENTAEQFVMTAQQVCNVLNVSCPPEFAVPSEVKFQRLADRTRFLRQDSLFAGTPSPRRVDRLVAAGVTAFLAPQVVSDSQGRAYPTFLHPDPVSAYESLIATKMRDHGAKVVAVTGSIGKTTIKDMLASATATQFKTYSNRGNRNLPASVARHVQDLQPGVEVFIQETGASAKGVVEKSSGYLRPDAFIVTGIGFNHVGDYEDDREALLQDKLSHDRLSAPDAVGFINADDEILQGIQFKRKTVTYSADNTDADYYAQNVRLDDARLTFEVVERSTGRATPVELSTHGRHNVANAVAAFAVSLFLGVTPENAANGLAAYRAQGTRQNLTQLGSNRVLIDCYNASEDSIASVSDSLVSLHTGPGGRRMLVLGDIDDKLGARTEEIHRRVGKRLAGQDGIDAIACYGPHMRYAVDEAAKHGRHLFRADSRDELNEHIREWLQLEDIIAFKGGQQMALSATIDNLFGTEFVMLDSFERGRRSTFVRTKAANYRVIRGYGAVLSKLTRTELTSLRIRPAVKGVPLLMIGRYAFAHSAVVDVTVPAPVRSLGRGAFHRCTSLRTVSLPNTLLWIGPGAFRGCTRVATINIPEGVETIEARAFQNCRELRQVTLPRTLKVLRADVFTGCHRVTVRVPEASPVIADLRKALPESRIQTY